MNLPIRGGFKMSLLSGKDRIDLYYFGAGHTRQGRCG